MSGTQLVIMAVAMGLMYWIARGMIGGYFAFFFIASPIVVGVVAGLIYGDLTKGLIIGGGIAAAFAGIIAPGGNLPTDSALAATTVIPIALATGLTAEQAIAFAVPMGLLGSFVTNLRKMINVIFVHRALIMNMIGKPKMIPYTVLGFIVVKAVGLNTLTAGLVAGCVAVLVVLEKREREKEGA